MVPVVLHPANAAAARAVRPPNRLLPGLRGDDLLLNTRQQPLRLGQGQSQVGDIGDITRTIDLQDVRVRPLASAPVFTNLNIQLTHPSLVREQTRNYPTYLRTPNLATVPRFWFSLKGKMGIRGQGGTSHAAPAPDATGRVHATRSRGPMPGERGSCPAALTRKVRGSALLPRH